MVNLIGENKNSCMPVPTRHKFRSSIEMKLWFVSIRKPLFLSGYLFTGASISNNEATEQVSCGAWHECFSTHRSFPMCAKIFYFVVSLLKL